MGKITATSLIETSYTGMKHIDSGIRRNDENGINRNFPNSVK
jgi:hypothetical protein